jgi:hypothetical protein
MMSVAIIPGEQAFTCRGSRRDLVGIWRGSSGITPDDARMHLDARALTSEHHRIRVEESLAQPIPAKLGYTS